MTLATLEELGLELNDDGIVEGIQFGRENRIQEWRDKKEAEEYAALFQRLYQRKWAAEARQSPERKARIVAALHRYRERHRERIREMENRRRREKYEAEPVVNQCEECGTTWEVPYHAKGPKASRFCSRSCRNKESNRRRQRPTMGIRKMNLEYETRRFLRSHPGSTAKQIADAIGAKPQSLRVCLKRWTDCGKLTRKGSRNATYCVREGAGNG